MIMRYFPQDNVGLRDKVSYSCGIVGKNLAQGIITTLILLYCLQVLKFNSSFLISTFLLSLIIESCWSLILGITFDNCRSHLGKYKLWIILGTISSIICSCWFFTLPLLTNKSLQTYLALIFILLNCCFLFIQLPYLVLISSFSSNSHTRNLTATMPSAGNYISRQMLFIAIVYLLTPSLNFLDLKLETYYYILGGACVLLLVSQCGFLSCIHFHQVSWNECRKAMPQTYMPNANSDHARLGRSAIVTANTSLQANLSTGVNANPSSSSSPALASGAGSALANSTTVTLTPDATPTHSQNQAYTPAQANAEAQSNASVNANASTSGFTRDTTSTTTNAGDSSKGHVLAAYNPNTNTVQTQVASADSSLFSSPLQNHNKTETDTQYESENETEDDTDIYAEDDNADESASGAAYAALSAHANYTASTPAIPREPYTATEDAFTPYIAPHTGIANATLDYNNQAIQGAKSIAATAMTQATYAPNYLNNSQPNYQSAAYPMAQAAVAVDTNNRYKSFSRYNNLQHYANHSNSGETKAHYAPSEQAKDGYVQHFALSNIFTVLFKNDQLMIMVLIAILQYGQFSMMISLLSFFFINNNLLSNFLTITFLILGFFGQLGSMFLFPYFARGSRRTQVFIKASLCVGIAFVLHSILQGLDSDLILFIEGLLFLLINIGMGSAKVAMTTMVADTVDYGEFKLSQRTDALVFAYLTTAYRISLFLSSTLFFTEDITTELYNSVDYLMPMSFEMVFEMILICSFLLSSLLLYKCFYKLNGTFYRNVLNNLQFLRQNQRAYGITPDNSNNIKKHFMLRYSLDVNAMIIKLKAKSESEVIQAMVQKLSEVNAITSEHDYMCDLKARLAIGPCGIAEGIAIPHAKSSAVRRATVVVATLDTPIDLGALDDKKCDLIFLLASPDDGVTHMNLLGRLSLLLNEPGFADRLRSSGSSTELFERLIKCEKNIVN